jgi:hypothetical protein
MEPSRMSPELVQLGQEALAAISNGIATGAPLLKCQLLASTFYEALLEELRRPSTPDSGNRDMLSAAADQCERTAIETTSPAAMLKELRRAIDLLQADVPMPQMRRPAGRPVLRVIEGGLSKAG